MSGNGESVDPTGSITESPSISAPLPVGEVRSLLIFQLGPRAYALDIKSVKQIIPMMKLTPLPKTGPVFEGLANIHGQFVPVIQTRECLGLDPLQIDLYTPIILIQSGEQVMGLIVDQVSGVASLRVEQIIHPGKIVPEGIRPAAILQGVVYLSGQMVLLIDPALLLDENQTHMLRELMRAFGGEAPVQNDVQARHTAVEPNGDGVEKKKARRETGGLRDPLAQELADLAEACPPSGWQPDPDGDDGSGES